jgi:hypothetical protein
LKADSATAALVGAFGPGASDCRWNVDNGDCSPPFSALSILSLGEHKFGITSIPILRFPRSAGIAKAAYDGHAFQIHHWVSVWDAMGRVQKFLLESSQNHTTSRANVRDDYR